VGGAHAAYTAPRHGIAAVAYDWERLIQTSLDVLKRRIADPAAHERLWPISGPKSSVLGIPLAKVGGVLACVPAGCEFP
jgi:hypothetical protein